MIHLNLNRIVIYLVKKLILSAELNRRLYIKLLYYRCEKVSIENG